MADPNNEPTPTLEPAPAPEPTPVAEPSTAPAEPADPADLPPITISESGYPAGTTAPAPEIPVSHDPIPTGSGTDSNESTGNTERIVTTPALPDVKVNEIETKERAAWLDNPDTKFIPTPGSTVVEPYPELEQARKSTIPTQPADPDDETKPWPTPTPTPAPIAEPQTPVQTSEPQIPTAAPVTEAAKQGPLEKLMGLFRRTPKA